MQSFLEKVAILAPKGPIALQQYELIIAASALMLLIIVPVFVLTLLIAWRYRAGNTRARYMPNWEHSRLQESIWWAVPTLIIAALSVMTWTSSHALDPFKPLEIPKDPVTIQVVALDWKWLFIYPDQRIATINQVYFPSGTPINFEITADAPMNSFWIPQLGGQIYAMAGMTTKLHLMADTPGTYAGSSANFSGAGFSGMRFQAVALPEHDFDTWVSETRASSPSLDALEYARISIPSMNDAASAFVLAESDLFHTIVMRYMDSTH